VVEVLLRRPEQHRRPSLLSQQLRVQLPTSADNVALPACAQSTPLLLRAAVQQSINISCPPGPQQQTRRTLLQRSIDGT